MKRLTKKVQKLNNTMQEIMKSDLFFQSLDERTKRDFYKSKDELTRFLNNLPLPK